ncbi:MAG: 50S ribosomal protein L10 [Candidatus Sungbacteria bacterium RIFCSPLOWO2_12_FULL_41_11]|uniref:Large ribosomal subunit protein uL10 n=1 Tax=Candidatus Sungbacteria bacterium RIFCSPLOWO2_12_FULL_41_11 TaxID=1802286 RepID=A0A1G2LSR0_9BACT|nr:MAG: 50S ribosomal protein L10 [Parcubacteria group bacterium GW2011_GWA2_42_14]OGZ98383.1 MAG: 50S ribosomal protein L10 [Candidatus Sungbacteria bacterium RIFCSPHIGHO2_02_FULL_41_12b]OHA14666.1 MAG: 50S ribosomal protein L10 [Candidatus Sungbacteria bacterium RIFCSPLOWO2_12_FULL_41_11]
MPLTREKKSKIVEELTEMFKKQKIAVFSDFRGVGVSKLTALRREMKKTGAEFRVAKKTFLRIALKVIGIDYDPKELEGEIGVILGYEDQIAPVKSAVKFGKENKTFKILKGILDGKFLEGKDVLALAKLPSREQLLAKLVWTLNSPIQGFHNVLNANLKNLVVVLNKINNLKK